MSKAKTFADEFLETMFGDEKANAEQMRNLNHMSCVLQRRGLAKPWCCAFHQGGGEAIEYCAGGPPKPEETPDAEG